MEFAPRGRVAAMNRRAWNDVAALWHARADVQAAFREVRSRRLGTLWPAEVALLGPVRGRRLLHLQCGAGEDTLSWAKLGARATGVDIAERRIAAAEALAARTGLRARFVRADAGRLPFRPASFDIVYTSRGAIVWLGDLAGWARGLARVLVRGGRFLLADEHPFLYCLVQKGARMPQVGWDYFDQRPRVWRGWHSVRGGGPRSPKAEVDWKLSDVQNALAGAGLVFTAARELAVPSALAYRLPRARRQILPQTLMQLWRKP